MHTANLWRYQSSKISEKHAIRPVNDFNKDSGKQPAPLVKIQILEK